MFGYVIPERSELKVRELEIYEAYYCGLCKTIGRHHGQAIRISLRYDFVFLAILLSSLKNDGDSISRERCIVHQIKKRSVMEETPEIKYCADMLILLTHYNFLDDIDDGKTFRGKIGKHMTNAGYKRLIEEYADIATQIEKALADLKKLEREDTPSLDKTAECFGGVTGEIFSGFAGREEDTVDKQVKYEKAILYRMGDFIGRWIYAIDALDDYESDVKDGNYNPFIYRKGTIDGIDLVLYNYMSEAVKAFDLLDVKKNAKILENVMLLGMRRKTDEIVETNKEKINEQRSI